MFIIQREIMMAMIPIARSPWQSSKVVEAKGSNIKSHGLDLKQSRRDS